MNILLIGKGFDQAHGLPTSYKDFLEFSQQVERIYTLIPGSTRKTYEKVSPKIGSSMTC